MSFLEAFWSHLACTIGSAPNESSESRPGPMLGSCLYVFLCRDAASVSSRAHVHMRFYVETGLLLPCKDYV